MDYLKGYIIPMSEVTTAIYRQMSKIEGLTFLQAWSLVFDERWLTVNPYNGRVEFTLEAILLI
jgi:hypothetical protein